MPQTRFTPEDLLNLENEGLFELVNGKLVEKTMSSVASKTAGLLTVHLGLWAQNGTRGDVYPEQSFQCFPEDPKLIRRPDIAVIVAERVTGVPDRGHVPVAPDVAIEVVSPNDRIYELDAKLREYRSAGIKLVWVVNPDARTVRVHRLDHSVAELEENDILSGENVLQGFSVLVKEILPPLKTA